MGMTQREVADRLGISRNRVSEIEADSPVDEMSKEESDPLETAKVKAVAGHREGQVRRLIREGIEPAAKHGGDRSEQGSDTTLQDRDQTYIVARLKRDHPDLAQQVIADDQTPI